MIISKTPYRISFFGGGTDYNKWIIKNGGDVLSTTIDKYCYIHTRYLPPFFDYNIRVTWSKIELCNKIEEINHPVVKKVLKFLPIDISGLEIYHYGDLPARSGIGSSSSFTVGLLNALYNLNGTNKSKKQLASDSIFVEQKLLKESVGSQDQTAASYGGFNHIKFNKDLTFNVKKIKIKNLIKQRLNQNLLLFFTGINRTSEIIVKNMLKNYKSKDSYLLNIQRKVKIAKKILLEGNDINDFGLLLNEAWHEKKKLSTNISNTFIDQIYETGIKNGALGGKILGAGGGGFILFFANPKYHKNIIKKFSNLIHVPFKFEDEGSSIIFNNKNEFSSYKKNKKKFKFIEFKG